MVEEGVAAEAEEVHRQDVIITEMVGVEEVVVVDLMVVVAAEEDPGLVHLSDVANLAQRVNHEKDPEEIDLGLLKGEIKNHLNEEDLNREKKDQFLRTDAQDLNPKKDPDLVLHHQTEKDLQVVHARGPDLAQGHALLNVVEKMVTLKIKMVAMTRIMIVVVVVKTIN